MSEGLNDAEEPSLQLEFAGDGPGSRIRTAIAADDGDFYIDPSVLPSPPWWFRIFKPRQKDEYSRMFCTLPLEVALSLLEKAEVPPLYRLGLGLRWGFLDSDRECFTLVDLAEVMRKAGILQGQLAPELDKIEQRSTYRIWKNLRYELHSTVDQYWSEHPGLHT